MGAPKQEASAAIEEETINSFFSEDNRRALARESSEGFFFGPLREWTYYGLVSAHQNYRDDLTELFYDAGDRWLTIGYFSQPDQTQNQQLEQLLTDHLYYRHLQYRRKTSAFYNEAFIQDPTDDEMFGIRMFNQGFQPEQITHRLTECGQTPHKLVECQQISCLGCSDVDDYYINLHPYVEDHILGHHPLDVRHILRVKELLYTVGSRADDFYSSFARFKDRHCTRLGEPPFWRTLKNTEQVALNQHLIDHCRQLISPQNWPPTDQEANQIAKDIVLWQGLEIIQSNPKRPQIALLAYWPMFDSWQ